MDGQRVERAGLQVDAGLAGFIEREALPGTGVPTGDFWQGLADIVADFGPENRDLLARREWMQEQIDAWHSARRGQLQDMTAYRAFLTQIGYLLPEGPDFQIDTPATDPEIAAISGPQLVVPITNARYALNAANARWGSLYDALYGTDALGRAPGADGHDAARGALVIAWVRDFLDRTVPLNGASWRDLRSLAVQDGRLVLRVAAGAASLVDPAGFTGYAGSPATPDKVILRHHGLHVVIELDASHPVGRDDPAHVADVRLEAAITAIMDCEDSIAAVDGADKTLAYANWLGLMRGDLAEWVEKRGTRFERRLAPDLTYIAPDGRTAALKGRALMLVRNVGHLMTTPAVLDAAGTEIGEGILDALVTVAIALHDLRKAEGSRNSTTGSVYVVKPKMHGPDEVAFADRVFSRVEDVLGLPRHTVKLGIMDEERRTSVNLKECIRAARSRIAFINTGFLDRTADEIFTSGEAGPMVRKGEMKAQPWFAAYEARNVEIGLACGLAGRAQIGKGMWTMPDLMAAMLEQKVAHPQAGANCAWVPSPTAATLHATHYHQVDVQARQAAIAATGQPARLDDLLTIPLALGRTYSEVEIRDELLNNAQGILGYVVRWIDQGIGCSKVPDLRDIGLMEDRATCRISSQAINNWLQHGMVSEAQVMDALRRMAAVVDRQNAGDPAYCPIAPGFDGYAFQAACDLIFMGGFQPSGYTEPVLHQRRAQKKAYGDPG